MGKIAFVFSGQGAQHVGMGMDFYVSIPEIKALFDEAELTRPGTLSQLSEGDGSALKQTENTQPCLYLADVAAAMALKANGVTPDGLAGFSLGEIPALAMGGAYTALDGFKIATKRGACMAKASEGVESGMMAIVKIPYEKSEALTVPYEHVYPVNYNAPMQLTVSGDKEELEALRKDIKVAGGRGVPLAVSGAFHSPYMTAAVEPFAKELESFVITLPETPVYANFTASPYAGDPKALMCSQINHPVQWVKTIQAMAADGFDTFIECGAGNTLQKLVLQILPEAKVYGVENAEGLVATLAALTA